MWREPRLRKRPSPRSRAPRLRSGASGYPGAMPSSSVASQTALEQRSVRSPTHSLALSDRLQNALDATALALTPFQPCFWRAARVVPTLKVTFSPISPLTVLDRARSTFWRRARSLDRIPAPLVCPSVRPFEDPSALSARCSSVRPLLPSPSCRPGQVHAAPPPVPLDAHCRQVFTFTPCTYRSLTPFYCTQATNSASGHSWTRRPCPCPL